MKTKILLILLLSSLFFHTAFAEYSNPKLKRAYNNIVLKLERKYSVDELYAILKKIDTKIVSILKKEKKGTDRYDVVNYIYKLNLLELQNLERQKFDFIAKKQELLDKKLKKQAIKEAIIRNDLLSKKTGLSIPNYVNILISNNRKLIVVNDKMEFVDSGDIKKIIFTKYYTIDSYNYNHFKNKSGYIVNKTGTNNFWFVENYSLDTKIAYSKSAKYFSAFVSDYIPFFLENGVYYSYNFTKFHYIKDNYGVYKSDLKANAIKTDNLIIFLDQNGRYNFISDYKKTKLISSGLLSGVKNKWYFLKELIDDKKYLSDDTDSDFRNLEKITKNITVGLSDKEKIAQIYDWILENISYTKNIDLNDYRIYSGIKTFKNKDGACEGYSKLMAYMLMYAGFTDLEVIRGYVIDAQDFPQIGHAWLRLSDKYYDPTFDDPLGAVKTRDFSSYYYYGLPEKLFYTNRYLRDELPEYLKTKSLLEREQIVKSAIYEYAKNNLNQNYNLLASAKLRIKNGFGNRSLKIEDFKKVLNYQILGPDYKIMVNGKTKYIKNYKYIPVTDNNIEDIISNNFNYDFEGLYLLNRRIPDTQNDYIIAYDINYHN